LGIERGRRGEGEGEQHTWMRVECTTDASRRGTTRRATCRLKKG
jgi:hypothetical protein